MLHTTYVGYRKIPKISPRAYFVSKALFEGLIYGGKFAFQNCLGLPYSRNEIYRFCFVFEGNFPGGGGVYLEGLIFGIVRYYSLNAGLFRVNWHPNL